MLRFPALLNWNALRTLYSEKLKSLYLLPMEILDCKGIMASKALKY
jgi:hypothetical protein